MQKRAILVELEKYCKMTLWLQKSASIQPRADHAKIGIPAYPDTATGIPVHRYKHRPYRNFLIEDANVDPVFLEPILCSNSERFCCWPLIINSNACCTLLASSSMQPEFAVVKANTLFT